MRTSNFCYETGSLESMIDFSLLADEKNILVQIFCGQTKEILTNLSDVILRHLPHAICIGTTTDGEIYGASITTLFLNTHPLKQPMFKMLTLFNAVSNSLPI